MINASVSSDLKALYKSITIIIIIIIINILKQKVEVTTTLTYCCAS